jgi:type IV secretion system protein TrbJ
MIDLVHDKRMNQPETTLATCRRRLVRLKSLGHGILRYRSWRSRAMAVLLATGIACAAPPALAQWVVFDPNNYAQNLLTAARALEQINNQIKSLTNQTQMLINQAKNLANLPTSTLTQLQSSNQKTQNLLSQAQNIAFDVQKIEQAFSGTYGSALTTSSNRTLIANAQTRWQTSVGAFEDSLKIQSGVVGNISGSTSSMSTLVSASQSATGALQAAQAGNQLIALQSQQLSDLIALISAKSRADALEQARHASTESQGQQQYKLFATRGGYVPSNVTMFSGN